MEARATYEVGRVEGQAHIRRLEGTIRSLSAARLVVALAVLGVIVGLVWWHLPSTAWGLLAALVALFVFLVLAHTRAFAEKARAEAKVRFHDRGVARLAGGWRAFSETGASYAKPDHAYTDDLDIFGPSSLFQLLDATETPFGRDALAHALAYGGIVEGGPPTVTESLRTSQAQEAVRELAPKVAFRERLSVEGAVLRSSAPDPAPFLRWASGKASRPIPAFVRALAFVLPALVVVVYLAAPSLGLPKASWLVVVALEFLVATPYRASMRETLETLTSVEGGFARYASLFAAATSEKPTSARLSRALGPLHATRSGDGGGVVAAMGRLERIVGFVDARRNEVFRLFVGPVLMWDVHCAALLDAWRERWGRDVPGWFTALGELEAFASLAGFAFDRPDHVWPTPTDRAFLSAKGLGHPLIDAGRRVGNDVVLPRPGTALVVTGSNMSGKSTLLRALGINLVLASVGAPVCARELSFGFVRLATSMRIKDSLEDGVSHFYAELKKLKRVVDMAKAAGSGGCSATVFFLLDEILHGTNSRERIIGARAVIRDLLAHGALGAVSTHDLGIADLAGVLPEAVTNVHFEEQVHDDGTMTFDYTLRQGTVQSSNALRLMRAIGLDVPLDDAPRDDRSGADDAKTE